LNDRYQLILACGINYSPGIYSSGAQLLDFVVGA
jgi:hypothetical protein